METFEIKGEFITLHNLLKAADMVASGGMAKAVIQGGEVLVNNTVETRRGKKLRKGDTVEFADRQITIATDSTDPTV